MGGRVSVDLAAVTRQASDTKRETRKRRNQGDEETRGRIEISSAAVIKEQRGRTEKREREKKNEKGRREVRPKDKDQENRSTSDVGQAPAEKAMGRVGTTPARSMQVG